ncbi:MAG: PorT family protein [Chitinophagaceae bacterium]|jgi:hypothetical protein|nr:PorT family protein [Chitinophagaceae bacterium]
MKKQTYLFAALLLMTTASYSQILKNGMIIERPKFGIQAGLSVPSQSFSDAGYIADGSSRTGFTAGINLEIPLRYGWYFQPEVNYSQMGGKSYQQFNEGDAWGVDKYNYLHVPLLIKYKALFSGFGVYFGPQYGYLLSAKSTYGVNQPVQGDYDWKAANERYQSELSGIFGLEYYFPTPNDGPQFGFSTRFQFGFTNINNRSVTSESVLNNGFFLTAGLRF